MLVVSMSEKSNSIVLSAHSSFFPVKQKESRPILPLHHRYLNQQFSAVK